MLQKLRSKTNKPTLNLPPGPFKLPFIGNLHLLAGSNPAHRTLGDLANKYGPLMSLQLGEVNTVVVSSPEAAKPFLKTHDAIFASRPSFLATEISCYGNSDIAFSPYGEYWRQLRKICTLELLSPQRVKSFRPIREEEVLKLCKWIALNEGLPINLTDEVGKTSYDIMVRTTVGKMSNEQTKFLSMIKEGIENFSLFQIDDIFPSKKFIHLMSGSKKRVERLHEKIDWMMGSIIDEGRREKAATTDHDGEKHENLLHVLLKVQDSGPEVPLTTDNIKSVLLYLPIFH
ncbi:hypothetical protein BUALT_Bualt06G0014000 [Buddleja alternifolia]|uniref:Cytochrome P450 n=1 Tax=Buddleja alternifolia TaxID=168488 RepID=A0AAV6XML8_9LAMI|nr:hypothetical protein BUALT_Bualt06G0014000 [Buddleja alternifolia]